MAMIYCRECGNKFSDRAVACPKCGYPTRGRLEKNTLVYIFLALFLGTFGAHRFYANKNGSAVAMLIMGTVGWLLVIPGIVVCFWALIDLIIGLVNINHPENIFTTVRG